MGHLGSYEDFTNLIFLALKIFSLRRAQLSWSIEYSKTFFRVQNDFFQYQKPQDSLYFFSILALTVFVVFFSWFAGEKDFLMVADVLNLKVIEVEDQDNLFERFIPRIYNSRASETLRDCVCHK